MALLKQLQSTARDAGLGNVLLAVAMLVIGLAYIWQVNIAATAGFTMRDIEREIEHLQVQQERYEAQIARLQSIDSVATRMQMLGLKPVEQISYIEAAHANVALR